MSDRKWDSRSQDLKFLSRELQKLQSVMQNLFFRYDLIDYASVSTLDVVKQYKDLINEILKYFKNYKITKDSFSK